MRPIRTVLFLLSLMAAAISTAVGAPPAIVTQGSGAATACITCHGVDGAGNPLAGFPALAHLPQAYFIKQIADFKVGTRANPIMASIAKALSSEDAASAAAYYASLPRTKIPSSDADPAVLARGEELARNGDWEQDIPPCFKCHVNGGVGVEPAFPPIVGQHATYIVTQLKAWRSGLRRNDPQSLMKALSDSLGDEDMQAVAQYLTTRTGAEPADIGAFQSKVPSKKVSSKEESRPTSAVKFVPPPESEIPDNEFGNTVLLGKSIFINTQQHASAFVGNGLNCANCHLNNGRKPYSAPLWAAYVIYPAYRSKTQQVDTIQTRIQGCFQFSMDGKAPPVDSKEMTALVTYHYWLASGAPTGTRLPGQGFLNLAQPPQTPDMKRGEAVYTNSCVICHGADGQGTPTENGYAFPPLWGKDSFNWGAGMHRINTAAGFIKANMPYGLGGSLTDQEAWDVALFVNSHDRPGDPRFVQSVEHTRDKHHNENCLYGRTPEALEKLLDKKAKADADKNPAKEERGLSPATAH
ncbi:MAG: c-type cytochrome [Gammaproteobacteria bacterium]|nr:c-type cytochrome [Gammaproteobacteria bacterium]